MAIKGIYTALSGALAQSQQLDTIANNLANVNTPGFKKDQQTFQEYLTANEKPPTVLQVPRVPASIESFYDMQGGDMSYVDSAGTFTDWSQGPLKNTNNPLDVAIEGGGFFEIASPQGVRLTRLGSFKMDGNGQLVTKEGYPVLRQAEAGADPATRVIRLTGENPINIAPNGDVYEGENVIARLAVVDVANKDSLQKIGSSMYNFKSNSTPETTPAPAASLKQGFLEMSNVNVVKEMTDMIQTTRIFESTQKAISAYDQMADKVVNQVGNTR
ncbi:MAG: flagellar basal-body rod protein FlgF [Proteobacteria bacterium]|jgi:flagellar basal-body rod protein FlgG|nr:flagellar basal-body rod protein FlgF [Pseudomonadota bacterium]